MRSAYNCFQSSFSSQTVFKEKKHKPCCLNLNNLRSLAQAKWWLHATVVESDSEGKMWLLLQKLSLEASSVRARVSASSKQLGHLIFDVLFSCLCSLCL